MINFTHVKRLFKRELLAIIRDSGIMLLLLGGPLLYSFFYPFPYKDDIVRNVPIAVIDMDKTPNSSQLVRMLNAAEELAVESKYGDAAQAYRAFLNREIYGIVYIEKDFQKNILKGLPQKVKVYTDGSYLVYYKQVTGGVQRAVKTMSAGVEIKKLQGKGLGKGAAAARAPVKLVSKNLYNTVGGYTEYVVPAVFVAIIQQILLIGIGMRAGTLREKKLKYGPSITAPQVLVSKIFVFGVFGIFYFLYFFVVMYNFWGFTGGSDIIGLFIYFTPFVLAAIMMGVAISSLFKYRESSMVFIIVTSLPIVFMSGAIWPAYLMPWPIKLLRLLFPMSYGVHGVIHLFIMNAPFKSVLPQFLAMWGLVCVYGALAYAAIKNRFPNKI